MEPTPEKPVEPAPTAPIAAAPGAWQPFSFDGVAAFARAPFARLFLAQLLTAVVVAGCVLWFLARQWCPIIQTAISQLPAEGAAIHAGRLLWPDRQTHTFSETQFLALIVTPAEFADTGLTADLQFELGETHLRLGSLFGYLAWPYPEDRQLPLTRGEAEPWWGAWKPVLLAGVAVATILCLFLGWALAAMPGTLIVWMVAFLANRESSRNGRWQLASAALLPGAWLLAMGVVLYGLEWLPLLGLLLVAALQVAVGSIYLFFAPFFLPRVPEAAPAGNPFHSAATAADLPSDRPPPDSAAPRNPFAGGPGH